MRIPLGPRLNLQVAGSQSFSHPIGVCPASACLEHVADNLAPDVLTMALLVASHSLPLVSPAKLQILPLHSLIHLVVVTISSTLHSGKFLRELATSIVRQDEHLVHIPVS